MMRELSRPRRVGVLGAGYIAQFHMRALQACAGAEAVAVCDLRKERAQRLAQAFGVEKSYSRLDDMLEQANLDTVHILLPPDLHFSAARKILEAGYSVMIEKPLSEKENEADELLSLAAERGLRLGVSHNFLFYPAYERLRADIQTGILGRLDNLEIIWHKPLPQRLGSAGIWMLRHSGNIMLEVGPHQFTILLDLLGMPDSFRVVAEDRQYLTDGSVFYRRWRISGQYKRVGFSLRFSFGEGFAEHRVHVRGTLATATTDFEQNTYILHQHGPRGLDLDRYMGIISTSMRRVAQGTSTFLSSTASKFGLIRFATPYQASITRCLQAFYQEMAEQLDSRVSGDLGKAAIVLGHRIIELSGVQDKLSNNPHRPPRKVVTQPNVLVIGGGGFIGQWLVKRLANDGQSVRVMIRSANPPASFSGFPLDIVHGDFTDIATIEKSLDGIETVYHLARGFGPSRNEYIEQEVVPTKHLAEACLRRRVRRLIVTSSIAIYYAGKRAGTINENTSTHSGVLRTNLYAYTKACCEMLLLNMYKQQGLPVVIVRPGIVIGSGGNPLHAGIGMWHYGSVFQAFGQGHTPLPIVLAEDIADALVRCLDSPNIEGETFNLVGDPMITAAEYLEELERWTEIQFKHYDPPHWLLFTAELGKWLVKTAVRDLHCALPSYRALEGRSASAYFDCSKAKRILDWKPTTDKQVVIEKGIYSPATEFLLT